MSLTNDRASSAIGPQSLGANVSEAGPLTDISVESALFDRRLLWGTAIALILLAAIVAVVVLAGTVISPMAIAAGAFVVAFLGASAANSVHRRRAIDRSRRAVAAGSSKTLEHPSRIKRAVLRT